MLQIVGISGSLRRDSTHTAVLEALRERLVDQVHLHVLSLADIPLYNEDLERCPPSAIAKLWKSVDESDGMIVGTPEYNHGMSGAVKNALDWLSRPHGNSPLKNKHVLTFTASPAFTGGVRAQAQLNETLSAVEAVRVPFPQIAIAASHTKMVNGLFTDENTLDFMIQGVSKLVSLVRRDFATTE